MNELRIRRKVGPGSYVVYGEVRWRPFALRLLGWTVIGRKREMTLLAFLRRLAREWVAAHPG